MKVVTQGVLLCIFFTMFIWRHCIYLAYGSNHLAGTDVFAWRMR